MSDSDVTRNPAFAKLRAEIVTKPDGRYLIYYTSDTGTDRSPGDTSGGRQATPAQRPWSPETGPVDGNDGGPDV